MTTKTRSDASVMREHLGRERKVSLLVSGLLQSGFTANEIAHFTDAQWHMAASGLGIKRDPSGLTRRLVVERLAQGAQQRALCPTCGEGDPEGVPGPRKPFGHSGNCAR
jgi:hypothetical protein